MYKNKNKRLAKYVKSRGNIKKKELLKKYYWLLEENYEIKIKKTKKKHTINSCLFKRCYEI